jgi:hypothetical protein
MFHHRFMSGGGRRTQRQREPDSEAHSDREPDPDDTMPGSMGAGQRLRRAFNQRKMT